MDGSGAVEDFMDQSGTVLLTHVLVGLAGLPCGGVGVSPDVVVPSSSGTGADGAGDV